MSTPARTPSTASPAPRRGRLARAVRAAVAEIFGFDEPAKAPPARRVTRTAYHGAESNRFNLEWRTANASADTDLLGSLMVLRARARDLSRNNPYIERFQQLLVSNLMGPGGVGHQAQVRGPNGELDERVNDRIEAAWRAWSTGPVTADGKLPLLGFAGLQLETCAVDGEAFTRQIRSRDFPHGLALQPIDPDLVDERLIHRGGPDGNEIRLGVEIDGYGRPLAYHVWDWPDYVPGSESRGRQRMSASEILHHYRMRRAHQTRGVSWIAKAMTDTQDLAGYDEAVIIGARAGANQVAIATWKNPDMAPTPASNEDEETARKPLQMDLNPGTIMELDPGLEMSPFDPKQPSGVYADFTKTVLRRVACGLGPAYASLTGDLREVNYSSTKVGLQTERELWQLLQQWWIFTFLQPIYETWLQTALLTGALELPNPDWRAYTAVKWQPRGWVSPEPAREAAATESDLRLGLTSRQRILASRGDDYFAILEELRQEREAAAEAGVSVDAPLAGGAPALAPGSEDDDEPSEPEDDAPAEEADDDEPARGGRAARAAVATNRVAALRRNGHGGR